MSDARREVLVGADHERRAVNGAAWERAKSLLTEAADLPAEDRTRFVVEHCPDPELRREVLDLLASPAPLSEIITAGALAPGDRLGPYVIDRVLGRGGMGIVYRARDTRLDRTVAIKVLPPELSTDPMRRERFNREARAIAAPDDPHICALHDISQDHGVDFLVMTSAWFASSPIGRSLATCKEAH